MFGWATKRQPHIALFFSWSADRAALFSCFPDGAEQLMELQHPATCVSISLCPLDISPCFLGSCCWLQPAEIPRPGCCCFQEGEPSCLQLLFSMNCPSDWSLTTTVMQCRDPCWQKMKTWMPVGVLRLYLMPAQIKVWECGVRRESCYFRGCPPTRKYRTLRGTDL